MTRYALLALPSANRVYRGVAPTLAAAELRLLAAGPLGGRLRDVVTTSLAGVPCLSFSTAGDEPLAEPELACLAHLSTFYALFTVEAVDDGLLRPVAVPPADRFDDDLVTIPTYAGKTNEQFTRLLLNVTIAASTAANRLASGGLAVLDPSAGAAPRSTRRRWPATTPPASSWTARTSRPTPPTCGRGCNASGSATGRRSARSGGPASTWGAGSPRSSPAPRRSSPRARAAGSTSSTRTRCGPRASSPGRRSTLW
ncbi:MAG TPA: hypothetical protein VMT69_09145 [Kineosporiaceae bacterium]|nr:hypothetical protein [Kineosporiaceae bacterium]